MNARMPESAPATPDTLAFAFEYLDRGWPVIPVDGKTPAVSWLAYQKIKPLHKQVREWFGGGSYNLAIVCGRYSGLVVVDCDSIEDAAWWELQLPKTPLAVCTGGGGLHFYYRYPDDGEIGCRTRVLGRRIDIRGEGGLAIAPASIHPETGRAYQWRDWSYYSLEEVPFFDCSWTNQRQAQQPVSLSRPNACTEKPVIRNGMTYINRIHAIAGEQGHAATFRAACKLRDSGMTAAEALEALSQWNRTNANPPWSDKELAHKVEDAYRNV